MNDAASTFWVVALVASAVLLIVMAVLWRRAMRGKANAELELASVGPAADVRVEAAEAAAASEIARIQARFAGVLDLDAEKERVATEIEDAEAATMLHRVYSVGAMIVFRSGAIN